MFILEAICLVLFWKVPSTPEKGTFSLTSILFIQVFPFNWEKKVQFMCVIRASAKWWHCSYDGNGRRSGMALALLVSSHRHHNGQGHGSVSTRIFSGQHDQSTVSLWLIWWHDKHLEPPPPSLHIQIRVTPLRPVSGVSLWMNGQANA